MIERLRIDDRVGILELLKAEQREMERSTGALLAAAAAEVDDPRQDLEVAKDLEAGLAAAIDRHLAVVLPILEYEAGYLDPEFSWLARFADQELSLLDGSSSARVQANRVLAWRLVWAVAGIACAKRRYEILSTMWEAKLLDGKPLPSIKMLGGFFLEEAMYRSRISGGAVIPLDGLTHLARNLLESEVISDHIPELRQRGSTPLGSVIGFLQDASYLFSALGTQDGVRMKNCTYGDQSHSLVHSEVSSDPRILNAVRSLLDLDIYDKDEVVEKLVLLAGASRE